MKLCILLGILYFPEWILLEIHPVNSGRTGVSRCMLRELIVDINVMAK